MHLRIAFERAQTSPTSTSTKIAGETVSFGHVAVKLGFITPVQLEEAIKVQGSASKAGLRMRLGEILIKKGYLTPEQFHIVRRSQTVKSKRIGAYELIQKLGEGGMGSVFKARQVFLDRIIALKILSNKLAKNKDFQDRFIREAQAVAKLNHPHIVAGIDVGSADGYCYFAMEYVDGESLGQYMQRKGGRLDEKSVLEYARQTALALHHAHQNNLLHRDVKPDNLLLDASFKTVKLADLGLARSTESRADDAALSRMGQAVGTPFYISPEQARGQFNLTPATDIYSLGASMFHLLTGQVPFDGPSAEVIMTRHVTEQAPSLCAINPGISPSIEKIVLKCMQKIPENRYPSAQALAIDIERLQAAPSMDSKATAAIELPAPVEPAPPPARKAKAERIPIQKEKAPPPKEKAPPAKETPSPAPVPSSHPGAAPLRTVKRRKHSGDVFGLATLVMLAVCCGAFYFLYPKLMESKTSASPHTEKKTEPPAPVQPAPVQIQSEGTPAVIKPDASGAFSFKDDFETSANLHNYEADPLMAPQEPVRIIADGTKVNHVLRLARVIDKDAACMMRILLPANLEWSQAASLSFMVWASSPEAPEIKIYLDHRTADSKRRYQAIWLLKNLDFKEGWQTVDLKLNENLFALIPSRQLPEKPQFLAVLAGKQGQDIEVFIDNLSITNPGQTAQPPAPKPKAKSAAPKPAPAQSAPKEEPVAPPPAATPAAKEGEPAPAPARPPADMPDVPQPIKDAI